MKKYTRYSLITIVVLALLVMTAVMASATDREVGTAGDLATAISSAASGDTITLTTDISGLSPITFSSGSTKTLTLNGAGHKLTFTGDGITVGANITLTVSGLTMDRASSGGETNGIAVLVNASSANVTLTNVVITDKFAVGVKMTAPATVAIGGASTDFEVGSKCVWLDEGSFGGLLTIGAGTFIPTYENPSRWAGAVICSGAEVIINGGTFYSVRSNAHNGAALVWGNQITAPTGKASPVTINNGTFRMQDGTYQAPLIEIYSPLIGGRWYHSYCGDGKTLLTINGGTFTSGTRTTHRGLIYCDNSSGIYGHAGVYADIVINNGTFQCFNNWTDHGTFKLAGAARLTINGGNFWSFGRGYFLTLDNRTGSQSVTHTIQGGTIETSALLGLYNGDTKIDTTHVNFGAVVAGEEIGPTINLHKTYQNGNIMLTWGPAFNDGTVNFYGGTYNISGARTLNENGEAVDSIEYSGQVNFSCSRFISGSGQRLGIYGGTFNYAGSEGLILSNVANEMPSPVLFNANPGKNGATFNAGPGAGPVLHISGGAFKNTHNKNDEFHLFEDATHGNKLIFKFLAGTFAGGKEWILVDGPAPIIEFGAPDTEGPTFQVPADTTSYAYGIRLTAASGKPAGSTLTQAVLNFYSGTYQMLGNNGFINADGGQINISGGFFKVANNHKLINFYGGDGVGNLSISGGTFELAGSGCILNYSALKTPDNQGRNGVIAITGGTFKSTGEADGVFFLLNGSHDGSFSIAGATFSEMTANARYFSVGQSLPFTPAIDAGLVFPTDPVKGLGGYTTTPAVGRYSAALTDKRFAGAQMTITSNYELAIFWKLTDAEVAAYTKTVITFEDGAPFEIAAKTVSDKYPNGANVESGYKAVKVVLDHITVRALGHCFCADLYVNDAVLASTDYSALEYIRKIGHQTIEQKAEKLAANAEADVADEENTLGLLASMTYLAFYTDVYARGDVAVYGSELEGGVSKGNIPWYNDKYFSKDSIYMPAFDEVQATSAAWTGGANANANLTSVGLRFTNNIQFYVEFAATSLDDIFVTYQAEGDAFGNARIVDMGAGTYRAYTRFESLSHLNKNVTFTLTGDTNTQTCTYSLNAFIYKYQNSTQANANGRYALQDVARSLYQFKTAVAAYYGATIFGTISANVQIVHPSGLDDVKGGSDRSPYYDYPIVAARSLRTTLAGIFGTTEETISLQRDSAALAAKEIAVGLTNRPITAELLSKLGNVNSYGFLIKNGQIAVAGYNDVTQKLALDLFADYCRNADKYKNSSDTYSVWLPAHVCVIEIYADADSGWVTDFPLPDYDNLTLSGSMDVGSGAVEYYYTGEGVTTANFEDYCATLVADGYTLYTSNEIEGSRYHTYKKGNVMVYVAYAAFSHAAEQNVTLYQPCIRIVSSPIGDTPLTNSQLIEQNAFNKEITLSSYTKITDAKITAMQLNRSLSGMNGSAYIITLEDGSFVVIDGGIDPAYTKAYNPSTGTYNLPVASTGDEDRLYNILCDLYSLAHGYEPDGVEHRICIAAWYITHFHEDHAGTLLMFAPKYGHLVDAKGLIANAPSVTEYANSYNPTPLYINELETICNSFSTPMPYYKVHTGWTFYIRNVEFEILLTHEDLYPQRINMFNDSSTIIRTTVYSTDGNGVTQGTPTTILWLGDLETKGSQLLRAAYGNYLQSDMCQVSHHGYNGCEWALYQLVSPRCLLWPNSYSYVRQYFNSTGTAVNYRLIHDLPALAYVLVCDKQNVTVTITKDGPQFALNQLYNAAENDTNPVTQYASTNTEGGIFQKTN